MDDAAIAHGMVFTIIAKFTIMITLIICCYALTQFGFQLKRNTVNNGNPLGILRPNFPRRGTKDREGMEVLGRVGFLRMGWGWEWGWEWNGNEDGNGDGEWGWDAPVTPGNLLCPNNPSLVWWKVPALDSDELQAPSQPKSLGCSPWSIPQEHPSVLYCPGRAPQGNSKAGEETEPEKKQRC